MGGVRAMTTRACVLGLLAFIPLVTVACGRNSEGQEATRRDPKLERKVEEMLPRIKEFSHLAAESVPAVRRSSSETLEAYLLERLDVEYPGDTLESMAAAYQAFGLLPDTVNVRGLLVDLMLEQAVGYYDPARDILFIRDEAPAEMEDAVLVHELVHALQDQCIDLDSLMQATTTNDARAAFQAAMEGHATAAMMAYQLSEMMGSSLSAEQLPEVGPEIAAALADPSLFPQLAAAPAIVRDPMLFVYLGGARYVQRLWRQQADRPPPFGEWLPESTEQLLHTERLLIERDSPTPMSIARPAGDWRVKYARDLGELEIKIYFEQHLQNSTLAAEAAAGWDGDAYTLLERNGELALVWYTAWDSEADADEFVEAYKLAFTARFGGEATGDELTSPQRWTRVERLVISGIPIVRVVETPPGARLGEPPAVQLGSAGD